MIKTLRRLKSEKLIHPPEWMIDNMHYLCQMGSVAYGCSGDDSDKDVYGFCVPTKDIVFPHTLGYINGFGSYPEWNQWQEHHVKDPSNKNEYDFQIFNIVKFFRLVADNNPNMIDAIYVPRRCVLHATNLMNHMLDNRDMFLHKGSWKKFRGYALSQLHKIKTKQPKPGTKRHDLVLKYGYDTKFSYHIFRLMLEVEQILTEGTLQLDQNGPFLRSVREGFFTLEEVHNWFEDKNRALEISFSNSSLKEKPDYNNIKNLLFECLEMHYGSLDTLIKVSSTKESEILDQIRMLVNEN